MARILCLVFLLCLSFQSFAGPAEDEADAAHFMNQYVDSFRSLDARHISMHFDEPFMTVTGASATALATRVEVESSYQLLLSQLADKGYSHSKWALLRVKALGAGVVIASGRAIRYKKDGSELETVGATYLLRHTNDGWRIAVLTPHKASMALALQ